MDNNFKKFILLWDDSGCGEGYKLWLNYYNLKITEDTYYRFVKLYHLWVKTIFPYVELFKRA